ncbi:MAG: S49 family peptidase [Labilithrix sp.]|nr:S49 family peptidase [Labilithrix sp.]MCW5813849.1 S49 family peptidase [Labilithrix sp.]
MRAAALLALATSLATLLACEGRPKSEGPKSDPPKKTGPAVAVLDLTGGVPEQSAGGLFSAPGRKTFDELLRATKEVADDKGDRSKGVLVKLGSASIGAARAQEIAEMLAAIKEKKKVYCHADGLSNATLMLAAKGCSSIWVSPAGEVESIGLAAQIVYMRRLLADELHLSIDFLQVGKFKGAEEPLTRDGPSPEARASLMSVLTDLRAAWTTTLAEARPKATPEVVEDGPWAPEKAKSLGLVDEVGYADDCAKKLREESGAARERVVFGAGAGDDDGDFDDLVRALAGESSVTGPIALVRATGSISMSAGGNGILGGRGGIVEKDFDRTIDKLEKDDAVKAVVVRIDSPGGSALASDLMWHHLMKLRKKKPLVFSVGDMAASGGYYLASSADYIFAEPMSIVGSIGVVGGKIGGGDALERIGVHAETFPANEGKPGAAERAAYLSPLVKWDDPTRARVLETMTSVYELFLSRVSEGRSTRGRTVTREQVAANAEGKIFSGTAGKDLGLVDEIGGLGAAIAKARSLAKLDDKAHVATVQGRSGLFDGLEPGGVEEAVRARTSPLAVLERVAPDVVPFVTSMAPLAEGERTAVCVPFALTVR